MLNLSICDFCYFIIFSHLLSLFVNLMMFNESTLLSRGAISCGVARTYCHTCRFGVPPPVSRNASRLKHPGLHATPDEDVALGLLIAPPKVGVTWRPGICFGRELEGFSTNYWPHF